MIRLENNFSKLFQIRFNKMNTAIIKEDLMVKNMVRFFMFVTLMVFSLNSISNAQYRDGNNYLGASIGLSFLGSAPQFGVNFEHAINVQDFGMVGIGGVFRYWGYSETYFDGKWSYTNVLIGAQGNYHFKVGNEKLDPYAGIVLAYDAGSVSWSGPNSIYSSPSSGGLWAALQGGIRYMISPQWSLTARVGFGSLSYGALEVGADYKF